MKTNLAIICIEDEPEVLEAIIRDLEMFEDYFRIEAAQSVNEARGLVQLLLAADIRPALFICDHRMPGETGVDYLIQLNKDKIMLKAKKMLLTGQAGLPDTVKAINAGGLDYYMAKPWSKDDIQDVVKKLLTEFVSQNVENVLPYMMILDAEKLSNSMRNRNIMTDI
jgi:FixJ family two-component response regulator